MEDLNKKLYNTTSHRFDYDSQQATSKAEFKNDAEDALNEAKSEKTVRIKSPRPMSGRKQMYNDVWKNPNENNPKCVLCNCQINVSDFADGTADFPICNYCKSTGIFRLDFYDNPYAYRDQRSRLSEEAKHNIASLSLSELRRLTGSVVGRQGDKARAPDSGSDSNLVKLIKAPIEKTDLITSPLNYLGYYSGRQRNRWVIMGTQAKLNATNLLQVVNSVVLLQLVNQLYPTYPCHQVALNKFVKIRLAPTCRLHTCYSSLKQLAASLWITTFD